MYQVQRLHVLATVTFYKTLIPENEAETNSVGVKLTTRLQMNHKCAIPAFPAYSLLEDALHACA